MTGDVAPITLCTVILSKAKDPCRVLDATAVCNSLKRKPSTAVTSESDRGILRSAQDDSGSELQRVHIALINPQRLAQHDLTPTHLQIPKPPHMHRCRAARDLALSQ